MLSTKFHKKEKWLRNRSEVWYRDQNPSLGMKSIFISTEFLASALNSSQEKMHVAFNGLSSLFCKAVHLSFNLQVFILISFT